MSFNENRLCQTVLESRKLEVNTGPILIRV
jgi:hypothetical protein